jgi:2-C-methyl-D-erythritol 4-phosphate cytidylyltransferase
VLSLLDAALWRAFTESPQQSRQVHIRIVEGVDDWPKRRWNAGHFLTLRLIEGGETRQQSVSNAVQVAAGDFVLVHDAARPLLSRELIARVIEAAQRNGAAIAALPVSDTVKRATRCGEANHIAETLPREEIWLAQTPQVFRRGVLLQALEAARRDGFTGTDCASLVERLCAESGQALHRVTLVLGEERNFKVTFAADLERAAHLLKDQW